MQIQLNSYFGALLKNPSGVWTLADLIAFDNANAALEEPTNFTDQSEYVTGHAIVAQMLLTHAD